MRKMHSREGAKAAKKSKPDFSFFAVFAPSREPALATRQVSAA